MVIKEAVSTDGINLFCMNIIINIKYKNKHMAVVKTRQAIRLPW
jgi:hypothetical protein